MAIMRLLVHSFLLAIGAVQAAVTAYGTHVQQPMGTVTAASAAYTGAATYNNVILTPPPVPSPPPPTSFDVKLQTGIVPGLSIPQHGSFFGFSIEFSVSTQVSSHHSSSFLQVPFLNLMANLRERAGCVDIRVGGNTQDYATLVSSTPDGAALEKYYAQESNPTDTPPVIFTSEIIKMMGEISALTNVRWYLGVPFNDTENWRLQIAEVGESLLGDHLLGLQAGNEPDLYSRHGHRPDSYGPNDYKNEFGLLIQAINADSSIPTRTFSLGLTVDTGFATDFNQNLAALAVEHYPTDNCYAQYGTGTPRTGQEMLPAYLTHKSGQQIVSDYLSSLSYAQTVGKPFVMFETNTASCGGFPGLSDSFTAALWAIDYGLQMAYVNFTSAMFHVGGQSVYYNVGAPVTNQSTFHQWTVGPVYYSALFVAEALGPSNRSQVLDLQMNDGNEYTPGYAIYENGQPMRVALVNFVDDSSGASDYTASISISGAVPAQVKVKYLSAKSVTQKYNFTWAGQTFGDAFSSDGRPVGIVDVQTVDCDQLNNVCNVKVPAPGAALVFLSDEALVESDAGPTMTFPTTANTQLHNTATINPSALATSNGNKGLADLLASTSRGSSGAFGLAQALPGLGALVAGALLVTRMSMIVT
ncbi:glycoside hydrolase family 79 protein [Melanogaster broomeanus]|nr:glycoside hydrolase family 79 protein [Melanogaster broomeanus]